MRALLFALLAFLAIVSGTPALAQDFQTNAGTRSPMHWDINPAPIKVGPIEGRFNFDANREFMTPDGLVGTSTVTPELSVKLKQYRLSAAIDLAPRFDRQDGFSFGIGKPNKDDPVLPLLRNNGPMNGRPSTTIRFGVSKSF